jgi:hypothetical protein
MISASVHLRFCAVAQNGGDVYQGSRECDFFPTYIRRMVRALPRAHSPRCCCLLAHTPAWLGRHRTASHKARSCTHWRAHGIPQAAVLTLSRSYQVMPAIAQCIAAGACRRRTTMRSSSGATHGRSTCASRHCAEAASRAFSLAHALSTPFCAAAAKRNSFGANGHFQPLSSVLTARAVRLAVHTGSSAWRHRWGPSLRLVGLLLDGVVAPGQESDAHCGHGVPC